MTEGSMRLVGLGPGAADQMSVRARQAIAESDVVIGYGPYIDLIADLLHGKEVVRSTMTQEIDRCRLACERAGQGHRVALVSSGDIGIYSMAALTYELLLQSGWTPNQGFGVELIPGITALSACAALVGAPLGHDFCAVSLSDLLTPWPVIARRLEAAGRGDFVVALYNPRSRRRQGQLLQAQEILLRHRQPGTPVAVVDAAYREGQAVRHTTLDALHQAAVGMLATVLIGNSATYREAGLMITPRGYGQKYEALTGDHARVKTRDGERAGRSLRMGLDGWRDCVRRSLIATPDQTPESCARAFDIPIGWVLSAIAEPRAKTPAQAESAHGPTGGWRAVPILPCHAATLVTAVHAWPGVRLTTCDGDDRVLELTLSGEALVERGDRIDVMHPRLSLSIDCSCVHRAWMASRAGRQRSVYLEDAAGRCLLRIAETGEGRDRDASVGA